MGGVFSLITFLSLFDIARTVSQPYGKNEVQYFRHAGMVLAISVLAVMAGVAINKVQWWSLPLTGILAIVVIAYWISNFGSELLGADTFTIVMPMAAILVWASLPLTRLELKRHNEKAS
jgi:NhaP-type Na+/H+ or K+/H+ antiporter